MIDIIVVHKLCHSYFLRIDIHDRSEIYHHIGKDLNIPLLFRPADPYGRNRSILERVGKIPRNFCSRFCDHFPCNRALYILRQYLAADTVLQQKLFIKFISSYLCKIITPRIKEHAHDQALRAVHSQRLAWAYLLI